jgi:hypothetical protein
LTCFLAGISFHAIAQIANEYDVKSTFIYHFIKSYVQWPETAQASKEGRFNICVFGESPIADYKSFFDKVSTSKLKISLLDISSIASAESRCHVVFIGKSETDAVKDILSSLAGKPLLTVSDINNFASAGGMIEFVINDDKVKMIINTKPAQTASLRIDSALLDIALKVLR